MINLPFFFRLPCVLFLRFSAYTTRPRGKYFVYQCGNGIARLSCLSLSFSCPKGAELRLIPGVPMRGCDTRDTGTQWLSTKSTHTPTVSTLRSCLLVLSNFIDPRSGAHTQNIERAWRSWKEDVSDAKCVRDSCLSDYLYRWQFRFNRSQTGMPAEQIVDETLDCWV